MEEVKRELTIKDLWHNGYRYALSLTHDKTAAEDIIQDAWLAVLNAKGPQTRPYLFSAVRSRFLNGYKRGQMLSIVPLNEDGVQAELDDLVYEPNISCHIEQSMLIKGLSKLRSAEREVLFLMTIEGYTANEVSNFTSQPRSTEIDRLHRAKKKLKDFIETKYKGVSLGR